MSARRRVEPLGGAVHATVRLPGSKSITNRALVCAALAAGTSQLEGVLDADDTAAMVEGLRALGAGVALEGDTAVVEGLAGRLRGGPGVRVDARLSGTTSRFLLPVALLADGPVTVDGGPPLRARPMADGIAALRALGAVVEAAGDGLPATVEPPVRTAGRVEVAGAASSQFLSGLLLVGPCLPDGLEVSVVGELRSRPYVEMTVAVMGAFGATVVTAPDGRSYTVAPGGYRATRYAVEPDASAASYFFAAAALCGGEVTVEGLGSDSLQGDVAFVDVLARMGATVECSASRTVVRSDGRLRGVEVDMADISDTAQTLAAIAPFAEGPTVIGGIGFIRAKETDRIGAVVTELRRLGVEASESDDGLRVEPGEPHPGTVHTYDDHRMAMSFAVLGLRAPGIVIDDPDCVTKTFPGFWDALDGLRGPPRGGGPVRVIAIDGPAGSGKSTIARAVAAHTGLEVLDTGAMYRAVTFAVLDAGADPADAAAATALAEGAAIVLEGGRVTVDGADATTAIRGPEVSAAVSTVSAHPGVRARLRDLQRAWMADHGGGVVEGRDIGTVVFPDAELKVFLTARPEVRARRRAGEGVLDERSAAANIEARDHQDSTRADSPLVEADDAVVIDTSELTIDEVVERIVERWS